MVQNQEKQRAQALVDGKGIACRKKVHRTATADNKNLPYSLKKLEVKSSHIQEVNVITNQGTVVHFNHPEVQASLAADTFTTTVHAETKQMKKCYPAL